MNKNIKGIDSIQTKEIHLGTPDNYTTIKKDGDRIKYGDKTFANTDDIWTIQANGTDVPANGGKVNVKGADIFANGEIQLAQYPKILPKLLMDSERAAAKERKY